MLPCALSGWLAAGCYWLVGNTVQRQPHLGRQPLGRELRCSLLHEAACLLSSVRSWADVWTNLPQSPPSTSYVQIIPVHVAVLEAGLKPVPLSQPHPPIPRCGQSTLPSSSSRFTRDASE